MLAYRSCALELRRPLTRPMITHATPAPTDDDKDAQVGPDHRRDSRRRRVGHAQQGRGGEGSAGHPEGQAELDGEQRQGELGREACCSARGVKTGQRASDYGIENERNGTSWDVREPRRASAVVLHVGGKREHGHQSRMDESTLCMRALDESETLRLWPLRQGHRSHAMRGQARPRPRPKPYRPSESTKSQPQAQTPRIHSRQA